MQLQHRAPRRLDQHAAFARAHRGRAAAAREQPQLAEELALRASRTCLPSAPSSSSIDRDLAGDDGIERVGVVVLARRSCCLGCGLCRSLSSMNSRSCSASCRPAAACCVAISASICAHRPELRSAANLAASSGSSAGSILRPQDVLDDLVALVHRLLDQRVAAERADDVEARHVGLVGRGQLRHRGRVVVREAGRRSLRRACAAAWRRGAR